MATARRHEVQINNFLIIGCPLIISSSSVRVREIGYRVCCRGDVDAGDARMCFVVSALPGATAVDVVVYLSDHMTKHYRCEG